MTKIDSKMWRPFKIKDIFVTQVNAGKLQVPTGTNIPQKLLKENGKIPRITVTSINNGIFGYYDLYDKSNLDYRVYSNFISVSFLGTVFYQKGCASLDMKVHCLKPIGVELNDKTGLFLVSAIRASLQKSSYADQLSSTVLPNLSIMLPATKEKEPKPDFTYMEQYMTELEKRVKSTIDCLEMTNG